MSTGPKRWIHEHVKVRIGVAIGAMGLMSCNKVDAIGPNRPTVLGDQCDIEDEQSAPLIVDWSTSARSRLEAAVLRGGIVTMKVSACDIEPLWQCASLARYVYASATSRRESERIADSKSLYARVPVSAVSLEAEISAGGELSVDKTTVGRFESEARTLAHRDLSGDCEGATHFVSAVDVGAFEFNASRSRSASGGAKTATVGAGGEASSERELLSADGDLARCADAAPGQAQPPAGCGAPIQIELTPLLPSLDIDEWRKTAKATAKQIMRECSPHGEGSSELWLTIEPSGRIVPGISESPFGMGNLDGCIFDIWRQQTVPPFAGPALATRVYLHVYPPARHADYDLIIEQDYQDSTPGIPNLSVGTRLGYPWEKYGVTPTEKWQ